MERLEANTKIIHIIEDYIRTYPSMRFGQALSNLGIASHRSESKLTDEGLELIKNKEENKLDAGHFNYSYRDIFFEESDITLEKLIEKKDEQV